MTTTEWLDRNAVAAYISAPVHLLLPWVKQGRLPPPSYHLGKRSPRWSRQAIDEMFLTGVPNGPIHHPRPTTDQAVSNYVQSILSSRSRRSQGSGGRHS